MATKVTTLPQAVELPVFGENAIARSGISTRLQNLGVALERLWEFRAAMKMGRPVQDAEAMLADVGSALKKTKQPIA